jgi:NAD(P)-dependent dehydrogenase (short-subunit alcohol dehydrogenase family)
MQIKDSVAFVTGANRGLGLAFARALLARGARKVYAGVRNPAAFKEEGITPIALDVTDAASVQAAVAATGDTTLLVNNAGIARVMNTTLDPALIDQAREIFETNYVGLVRATQGFAPVIKANGGGAVVNVLSDATWLARPLLAAYAASKAAAWSYTNASRVEVRAHGIQTLALHVGFLDTDMTHGFEMRKTSPADVVRITLDALEAGREEVFGDEGTARLKESLSRGDALYLNPPEIA